jgi:hypothetical protein
MGGCPILYKFEVCKKLGTSSGENLQLCSSYVCELGRTQWEALGMPSGRCSEYRKAEDNLDFLWQREAGITYMIY